VNLMVISWEFLTTIVGLTAVVWGFALWRGLKRRWLSSSIGVVLALVMSLVTVADFVNAHYAYLPRVADVIGVRTWPSARLTEVTAPAAEKPRPKGAVVSVKLPGPASGFGSPRAMVYFPPQYFTEPSRRFPVIYLLHGSPGAPIDWFRAARASDAGLAAAQAGHPVILVAPRASHDWDDDSECVDRPKEKIATYLVKDVVRDIDARFRTIDNRSGRALAGNSAGGYCALNLGLQHRDLFSSILDLSGFDRPTHNGGMKGLFGSRADLAAVAAANTPSDYVQTLRPTPNVRLWVDCGRSDAAARRDTVNIADALGSRGFDVTLRLRRGGHDFDVWRPALREAVGWAAAYLGPPPPAGSGV
jgi:enterochelin esterase-like enzyme